MKRISTISRDIAYAAADLELAAADLNERAARSSGTRRQQLIAQANDLRAAAGALATAQQHLN